MRRNDSVILFIDHQVGPLWELDCMTTRRRAAEMAAAAERAGIPSVVTTIAPDEYGPVIPELQTLAVDHAVVVRSRVNAWEDREVRRAIAATGRYRLIIAGGDTDQTLVPCALAARRDGFEVQVVLDASTSCDSRTIVRLIDSGVRVTTAWCVLAEIGSEERLVAI